MRMSGRWIALIGVLGACLAAPAVQTKPESVAPTSAPADPIDLASLVAQLGDDDYAQREAATRALIRGGPNVLDALRAALDTATDPEIRYRLRYVIDNLLPPEQAALVIRATDDSGLAPGDVITHVNSRRVQSVAQARRRMAETPFGAMLRVRGETGPREVGPIYLGQLVELSDYVAPRGATLAEIVRLYAAGFAERAAALLRGLGQEISPEEFSRPLRAIILYTAGDGEEAWKLVSNNGDLKDPASPRDLWSGPSRFDLMGPRQAPYHLELQLFRQHGAASQADPDLSVQRVLVPAGRYGDALLSAVELWTQRYAGPLAGDDVRVAGNMMAVAAWMFHELGLESECCRLIGPRSEVLSWLWVRVQTDAWLPFLAGNDKAAIDRLYDDALQILERAPQPDDPRVLTRNPDVAAMIAFFLYQSPDDPRVADAFKTMSRQNAVALELYVHWMLQAVCPANARLIREHLLALLPKLSDSVAAEAAWSAALLEYVQPQPGDDVLLAVRQRLAELPDDALTPAGFDGKSAATVVDVLRDVADGKLPAAQEKAAGLSEGVLPAALQHTLAFLSDPPATAAAHALLKDPVVVVPLGDAATQRWLVIARDQRLLLFDAVAGTLAPVAPPSPDWLPGPINWPWLGRDEASGRVWIYDRRRVVEFIPEDEQLERRPLKLNIATARIPAFDRAVSRWFDTVARVVDAEQQPSGECGEFLRSEIIAHGEYVADPDLPEISVIEPVAQADSLLHVAFRGGPQLLLDTASGRSWTAAWIAEELELAEPPRFYPVALWETSPPTVMLMTDQGLVRLETGTSRVLRVPLPGDQPFPALIPESTPYFRRDPAYVYCARPPQDGGQVYRLDLQTDRAEQLDMVNEGLPPTYYLLRSRAELRADLGARFEQIGAGGLEAFLTGVAEQADTIKRLRGGGGAG